MKNAYLFALIFASVLFSLDAFTSDEDIDACEENTIINEKSFTKDFEGIFNGKKLNYSASLKEKILYEKEIYSDPERDKKLEGMNIIRK
ncbi:hypothetical protein N9I51_01705 [Gammaproteobacteria bacterium]|nr:hypothetical protein [Gammaproteobacteria bacterium]